MKTIFKTLALGLLITAFAACEMHDPFDENTITGAVGPEAYWTIESSMVKAGESMNFVGQYYSTAAKIDHSEVWYDLWEKEERLVTASLIKAFTFSYSQNPIAQKRMLQTIAKYNHSEDLWSDSLHAYVLTDKFPISNTLAPISWVQPKDLKDFDKNLNAYFGQDFAKNFKDSLTRTKMNDGDKRHYAAYMNVLQGLSHLTDTILTPNGDRMPYVQWITDSTYNANTATWVKDFKQNDTIWSKTEVDTLGMRIFDTIDVKKTMVTNPETGKREPKYDTIFYTDTAYYTHPKFEDAVYVYDQIQRAIDSVWNNHVTFYDLILGSEGYSIEFKREYYINAELRIYDEKGTYSKTDSKEISIN
jgi:hypothetical protein